MIRKQNHNPKESVNIYVDGLHLGPIIIMKIGKLIQIHFSDKVGCLKSCFSSNFDHISFWLISTMIALNFLFKITASSLPNDSYHHNNSRDWAREHYLLLWDDRPSCYSFLEAISIFLGPKVYSLRAQTSPD